MAFFGAGPLHPDWSALLFVPDLFGGTGIWGQPAYFNHYSLAEVTGYAGILAVVAAVVLLTRSFGRRRSPLRPLRPGSTSPFRPATRGRARCTP